MKLTAQQQQVLDKVKDFMASDASVFILKGYAGTGKTTMIKHIAEYVSQFREVRLMAPTGRAARVLQMKTNNPNVTISSTSKHSNIYPAATIHKTIYGSAVFEPNTSQDVADSEFKFHFSINVTNGNIVAVVDEASMLCSLTQEQELFVFGTNNLMDDLLTYVRPSYGGKVIFVGDPAQLPPVGETVSNALNADFFEKKGLKVMQAELTEVLRQTDDSVILKNAMQIRDLLDSEKRNRLVFEEKKDSVESITPSELLGKYVETRKLAGNNDSVIICYSNRIAAEYNREIRKRLYGKDNPDLQVGDVLLVVQNNYLLDMMNGEFVSVLSVGERIRQSAPVYVQEGGAKEQKLITMEFVHVKVTTPQNGQQDCMLLLDLLNNGEASLKIDEQRALYINFRIRHSKLSAGASEFAEELKKDKFFNCLKAKYGYAVTGHKCQGGEWEEVFVDFTGRTGLSDDCLRWAYTATTRAQKKLYVMNLPHTTPFMKFRIEPIQQCSKISEECRIIGNVECSPFHDPSAPNYLHAKWMCVENNMKGTPYKIDRIESKPYQEIYYIKTPDSIERYDIRYKKGGIFLKAVPQRFSAHSEMICLMLDNERTMPLTFDYVPSDDIHEKLYNLIRSSCDGFAIQITNVVEHKEDYSVIFYLRTSDTLSYIKVYINESGFVTYAKPMSMLGKDDKELALLIEEIQNHFE